MYIWLGLNVDEQYLDIREKAKIVDKELKYINSCFTLPLHISIKMSFDVKEEQFESIVNTVCEYYKRLKTFELSVKGVENAGNIVWIRYYENVILSSIKDDMNALLKDKFNIGLHEYDHDYLFHTTLFMENDESKNSRAFEQVKNVPLPKTIRINRFSVGYSPNGELGTYKIYREIVN